MPKAPASYKNRRRPPLMDAIRAEGNVTMGEAADSLISKGYFTPRPRPWKLASRDRGLGHYDFAIVDRFGDLVAEVPQREDAELIIAAVNSKS